MGFMDNLLEKSDARVASKIMAGLARLEPRVSYELQSITCSENASWSHVAIRVNFPDEPGYLHRCRNTWHFSTNPSGLLYLPLPQISRLDYELATAQLAAQVGGALHSTEGEITQTLATSSASSEMTIFQSLLTEIVGFYENPKILQEPEDLWLQISNQNTIDHPVSAYFVYKEGLGESLTAAGVFELEPAIYEDPRIQASLNHFEEEIKLVDSRIQVVRSDNAVAIFKNLAEDADLEAAIEAMNVASGLAATLKSIIESNFDIP